MAGLIVRRGDIVGVLYAFFFGLIPMALLLMSNWGIPLADRFAE